MKLEDSVTTQPQIKGKYAKLLEKLNISSVKDLLTYFPVKYVDTSIITSIKDLIYNHDFENTYQIKVKIKSFKNSYIKSFRTIQQAVVYDQTGELKLIWFNQNYLKDVIKEDKEFIFSGKLNQDKKGNFQFLPSLYEEVIPTRELVHLARFTPEYALTQGISKKWFRNRIKYLVDHIEELEIPNELEDIGFKTQNLQKAIKLLHFPESLDNLETYYELLSLYELINIQLKLIQKRAESRKLNSPDFINTGKELEKNIFDFISKLPFELTEDQRKVVNKIKEEINRGNLLNELIQGDVGSGKTIVAIIATLITALNNFQTVILAPTTILAKQHYSTFSNLLKDYGIKTELVTSENKNTKSESVLIGTSAVLARKANLISKLGMVIVDEQHKFGVQQREELLAPFQEVLKSHYPHFVNMTATPIPRTIAQAFFGDVSISLIKTKPKGRLPIKTHLVPTNKREDSYQWIDEKITEGEQVYWICPLISESDKLNAKSAEETFEQLRAIFPHRKIALLHGKLKEGEKSVIMKDFLEHKFDILVSTSVIEVGIDVPNATVMVIESAERFGLAQLHQIRGRVGRSDKQSWCFLFYSDQISRTGTDRLKYLASSNKGLEIAEYDLKLRGPGEIYGSKQSGIPKLKIAKLNNLDLIKKSQQLAEKLYNSGINEIKLFN